MVPRILPPTHPNPRRATRSTGFQTGFASALAILFDAVPVLSVREAVYQ